MGEAPVSVVAVLVTPATAMVFGALPTLTDEGTGGMFAVLVETVGCSELSCAKTQTMTLTHFMSMVTTASRGFGCNQLPCSYS